MEYVKLRNYIELISGRDLTKAQYNDKNNGIPYIMGASNMTNGKLNIERWTNEPTVIGEKGDLIISVKGTVGELLILEEEKVHLSRQVMAIRPKEGYDVKFVFYYMKYYLDRLKEKAKGMIPGVTREDILDAEFIEVSSEEQQRIIKILDKAQELIDKRKEQIEALDELVKSRFIEMFGSPKDNPNKYDVIKLDEIIEYMGDIGSNGANSVISANLKMSDTEDYALMVRTLNFTANDFTNNVKYVSKDVYEFFKKSKVFGGEIIFNKIGSAGINFIMPYLNRPVSLGLNQIMLRTNSKINTVFLYNLLNTDYGKHEVSIRTQGAVTKSITKGAIKEIPIFLPPIELQNQFDEFVKQVDKLKFAIESSLKELENNFNSLMQKAFNGELFN